MNFKQLFISAALILCCNAAIAETTAATTNPTKYEPGANPTKYEPNENFNPDKHGLGGCADPAMYGPAC